MALKKIGPDTPAFANKIQDPNFPDRYKVIYESTDGVIFGKGVPRNGSTFQQLTKIEARYQEVSSGNFQLVTMFPTR
ncbi:hypothetical protein ABW636_06255 [Aquimarina sp. 2201CG1-2-11]|uniref:hypothetical protein n=1 Tax=Aquimarina discodermiae TaxID=3231043 RepID=UPI003463074F